MRVTFNIRILVLLFCFVFVPSMLSPAISAEIDLLHHRWPAMWIACPDSPHQDFGVYYFRKDFSLARKPQHFTISVTGDNRYELFVNGVRVLEGPARGDLFHWRYATIDISKNLRSGANVLAAIVWNFAELAPMAQMSNETGLLVQGDSAREAVVNSNSSWKCRVSHAIQMIPVNRKRIPFYSVVGPGERWDGSEVPWGWQDLGYNDSKWQTAATLGPADPRGIQDSSSPWMLVPRNIPFMEEKPERLVRLVRAKGIEASENFLQGRAPITIPANTSASLLFDQTHETTAYPELLVSGGRGSTVTLTYAEALWKDGRKGNRNVTAGKKIVGYQDVFLPDGGDHRMFRPLWWRTYRYLQIDIKTASAPLVLDDFRGMFTAYPFKMRATFASGDPVLEKMWQVGWRTARLCAHETYMDCPYYEQLQYAGDTRIQILISLYMTGDDRLAKNAIELLNDSRIPEGITQSRYPSHLPQFIPPFSLFWIDTMHDLWWYHGDANFLRQFLPGMRDVLGWFERRMSPTGLLGKMDWWNFVDWTKNFKDGVPPMEANGQSSILSLQFAAALRAAGDLESAFGSARRAESDRALAARIAHAVYATCWNRSRGLLADTPAQKDFSQHANILGVLTDAIPIREQRPVLQRVLTDPSLTQCSYYFRFYLFRAMDKAGLGDEYLSQLGPWRRMLKLGLTTWAEMPEPTRSDCHAWSAHPNFDFLATVAGIDPAKAGFRQVSIEPHLGPLTHLSATLPVPQGEIEVHFQRNGNALSAEVSLPPGMSGEFIWSGEKTPLRTGLQHLQFPR